MKPTLAFFGSSLVSSYWNGAATYYRGIVRALYDRGWAVTFYEPDAYERQAHRDIPDPDWARVVVYSGSDPDAPARAMDEARHADVVVKASGVGVFDDWLDAAVASLRGTGRAVPVLGRRRAGDARSPARAAGRSAARARPALRPGADLRRRRSRRAAPTPRSARGAACRSTTPSIRARTIRWRRRRASSAICRCSPTGCPIARRASRRSSSTPPSGCRGTGSVLGGSGWAGKPMPANVDCIGHVPTRDHNAFNCSPLAVLNVNRESMARYGYSPATRVFEAAGAGACLITDACAGDRAVPRAGPRGARRRQRRGRRRPSRRAHPVARHAHRQRRPPPRPAASTPTRTA